MGVWLAKPVTFQASRESATVMGHPPVNGFKVPCALEVFDVILDRDEVRMGPLGLEIVQVFPLHLRVWAGIGLRTEGGARQGAAPVHRGGRGGEREAHRGLRGAGKTVTGVRRVRDLTGAARGPMMRGGAAMTGTDGKVDAAGLGREFAERRGRVTREPERRG